MKQQFIDTLNEQIYQLDRTNAVLASTSGLNPSARQFVSNLGFDARKVGLGKVIVENIQTLENCVNEAEKIYSTNQTTINTQRNDLNQLKATANKQVAEIKNAESKNLELKTKIQEVNAQQQQLTREKATITASKVNLINSMSAKQISFVLQKAIASGKKDVIDLLIIENFDINFQNSDQETLLHIVLKSISFNGLFYEVFHRLLELEYNNFYKIKVFQKLISHKDVNVNITNKEGNTALSICIKKDNINEVKSLIPVLLRKGASAEPVMLKAIKDQDLNLLQKITQLMPTLVGNKNITNKTITEIECYVLENCIKQGNLKVVENIFKIQPNLLDQPIGSRSATDFSLEHSSQEMYTLVSDLTENFHISLLGANQ